MLDVSLAMVTVMGGIAFWSAVFAGVGNLVLRLAGNGDPGLSFDRFWTGLATVVLGLQIWHLFLPVDWKAALVISGIGLVGIMVGGKARLAAAREFFDRKWMLVALICLCAWAANLGLRVPWNYDSGLYHFQSVRWANEYAIVPGLGNLHPRLAFNQSYFLYVALLNISPFFQKGHTVANALLLVAVGCQLLWSALRANSAIAIRVFSILMLALVLKQATRESLSSPSPDYPIFMLGVVALLWLIESLARVLSGERLGTRPWLVALLITCAGLTFKLSFLAVGLGVMGILTVLGLREGKRPGTPVVKALSFGTAAAVLSLGVWIARGIISSGYPLFPATVGAVEVDWRIHPEAAESVQRIVYSWARNPREDPDKVLKDSSWLKTWIKENATSSKINRPVLLFVASLGMLAWLHYRHKERSVLSRLMLLPLLPPVLWVVYWFVTAPDPRFALGAFNLLGAWSATLLLLEVFAIREWDRRYLIWSAVALALILGAPRIIKRGQFLLSFGNSAFGAVPTPPLMQVEIPSGLMIHVPRTNDQAWNAPLPSAPVTNGFLERRGETLQRGFRDRRTRK